MKIRRKHIWRTLLFFVISGLLFVGYMRYIATIKTEKRYEQALAGPPYDVIIVPGYPFHGEHWENVMRMRVVWSAYLYRQGIAKNIIYSGSAVYSPYIEAEIMALYAAKLGVDTAHIYTEPKAEHSTENVYYSYHLAKQLGFNRIALASDPFQTAMLELFVENEIKSQIGYIPVVFDILEKMDTLSPVIDPAPARITNFESIKKREGFWKRLQGTMGKNIDRNED